MEKSHHERLIGHMSRSLLQDFLTCESHNFDDIIFLDVMIANTKLLMSVRQNVVAITEID